MAKADALPDGPNVEKLTLSNIGRGSTRTSSIPPSVSMPMSGGHGTFGVGFGPQIGLTMRWRQIGLAPGIARLGAGFARLLPNVTVAVNGHESPICAAVPAACRIGVGSSVALMSPPVSQTSPTATGFAVPCALVVNVASVGDSRSTSTLANAWPT